MKNEKGFTLIELLVTIALMLSILGIAIVSFINISNRKKEEAYKLVKEQIIAAAEQYFDSNVYLFEGLGEDAYGIITVGKLVDEDYLNKVTDPRDGKSINYCSQVQVKKENGVYKTTYQETDKTDCPDTINSVIVSEPGAPSVAILLEGTKGNNGWYTSDVNLTARIETNNNGAIKNVGRCSTPGVIACTEFTTQSKIENQYVEKVSDTKEITIGYKVTNISGKSAKDWKTLKVDTKAPTITTYIENENQWVKEDSKYGYDIKDNTSGIDKITNYWNIPGLSEEDANSDKNKWNSKEVEKKGQTSDKNYGYTFSSEGVRKYKAQACDKAGNCADGTERIVKIDKTAPTCSVTLSGSMKNKNQNYWYTSNVTLKGNCSDSLSGCKQDISKTISKEGKYNKTGAGQVSDRAGNTNKCTYETKFGIDKTPPVFDESGAGRVHCTNATNAYNSWGYSIKYHDNLSGATAYLTEYYSSWDCGISDLYHWATSKAKDSIDDNNSKIFTAFAGCNDNPSPGARFKLVDGAGNESEIKEVSASKSAISSSYSGVCNKNLWFTENR